MLPEHLKNKYTHQIRDLTRARARPGIVGQLNDCRCLHETLRKVVRDLESLELKFFCTDSTVMILLPTHTCELVVFRAEAETQFHLQQLFRQVFQ